MLYRLHHKRRGGGGNGHRREGGEGELRLELEKLRSRGFAVDPALFFVLQRKRGFLKAFLKASPQLFNPPNSSALDFVQNFGSPRACIVGGKERDRARVVFFCRKFRVIFYRAQPHCSGT